MRIKKKQRFLLPFLFILVILPFGFNRFFAQAQFGQSFMVYLLAVVFLFWQGSRLLFSKKNACVNSFSVIDLLLVTGICFFIIHSVFINSLSAFNASIIFELLAYTLIYSFIRNIHPKNLFFVVFGLSVAGLLQAVYGVFQLVELVPSNHAHFKLTGSFVNPGPYAGYLVSSVPFTLLIIVLAKTKSKYINSHLHNQYIPLFIQKRSHIYYSFFILFLLLQVTAIVLTQSRAAWQAFLMVAFYMLPLFIHTKRSDNKTHSYYKGLAKPNKILAKIILVVFLALTVGGLYFLKKDSADGRLLIWQVSSEIIKDKPIFGVGFGGFKANYMEYQAGYFQQNTQSKFSFLADNTLYPFNEFLRICTEFGLFGFILAMALLYFLFFGKTALLKNENLRYSYFTAKAGLLAILVFGFFSYPLELVPIKLTLVICTTIISSAQNPVLIIKLTNKKLMSWSGRFLGIVMLLVSVWIIWQTITMSQAQRNWRLAETSYKMKAYKHSLKYYNSAYADLQSNGEFLVHYGKALSVANKFKQSNEVLNEAKNYLSNSVVYTTLGDNYKSLGDKQKAEQFYLKATQMLPVRFYPKYLLAKLYFENEEYNKARKMANEIMVQKVKIESKAVTEIRDEMRSMLNTLENL